MHEVLFTHILNNYQHLNIVEQWDYMYSIIEKQSLIETFPIRKVQIRQFA